MQKEPSMSYTDALAKAWEDNPDLMDAYDAEEDFKEGGKDHGKEKLQRLTD